MSRMHFDEIADVYAGARPPYPTALFDVLEANGVIGDGFEVLEIGAGTGLATAELIRRGCHVTAVEPGSGLARILRAAVPEAEVIVDDVEEALLLDGRYSAVVAATSMHWVDLARGLPRIYRAVRPGGSLAVFRTIFGDDTFDTEFRRRVNEIVANRVEGSASSGKSPAAVPIPGRESRPTMAELGMGGWFEPVRTERWQWSIAMTAGQIARLFATFSDWTPAEVQAAASAAAELGGVVTEHYQSQLHLLRATTQLSM